MFSHLAKMWAPGFGFVLGLVITYGFADARRGPTPPRILQDSLVMRMSIGSGIRDVSDESFASFDERFADRGVKKGSLTRYRLGSLEVSGAGVLVDESAVFAPSSGILLADSTDSFAERFAGTRSVVNLSSFTGPPLSSWVVQLIGDDTEATALLRFRQMQNKHKAILGIYKPLVVNTTLTPGAPPVWTRVRVGLNSREAAESLCARLESAGERCVVQRNTNASSGG
jgi:SPOR domain